MTCRRCKYFDKVKKRELCQRFVSNLPLYKANRKIADAKTSVNSDAFIMGLPKMHVLNVARVGQTHTKISAVSSSNWQDAQTGLVTSPILWRCLLRQQCPVIRETRILSYFLGRLKRYLVVCSFGSLFQNIDCLHQLLNVIQCLECASMTHLLFISRTIEADSETQGSGPQKWESKPIHASLSASSLPLMSQ
jgi:hypothetical protein